DDGHAARSVVVLAHLVPARAARRHERSDRGDAPCDPSGPAPLGGDRLVRRPARQPLFCAGRPRPRGARVPSFARARRRLRARERRPLIANGVRIDADLALFDTDHDHDLGRAVEVARAEYAVRPSVHIADILSWAEFRSGDLGHALVHSEQALRLGTQDPLLLYHAGAIAQAAGDDSRARTLLGRVHDLNPQFSLLRAAALPSRLPA